MEYFMIMVGSHWCDISSDIFKPYRTSGFSTVLCDAFDASGSMVEIRRDDVKLFVPHTSVLLVVNVIDGKAAAGFGVAGLGDG